MKLITLIITLVIYCSPLSARETPPTLAESFIKARQGDYVVAYLNKAYTLLHIHDHFNKTIIIEEITVPKHAIELETIDWQQWVTQGAPGNTSWVMYEIAPSSGTVLEFYSFTQQGWASNIDNNNFLATLLQLELRPVRDEDRRRVGPRPLMSDLDRRRLWHPPAYFKGQRIDGVKFKPWKTTWPADGTDMAGRTVEIYLPEEEGPYPSYFPYWVEIRGNITKAKLRLKDAGTGMISIKEGLPLRPPQLLDQGKYADGKLTLRIDVPKKYNMFTVIATAIDQPWKDVINLPHDLVHNSDGIISLVIRDSVLENSLRHGERYRFTITPRDHPRLRAETIATFSWPQRKL